MELGPEYIPLAVTLVVGAIGGLFYVDHRRKKALRAFAKERGLSYETRPKRDPWPTFSGFELVRAPDYHHASHSLAGNYAGRLMSAFELTRGPHRRRNQDKPPRRDLLHAVFVKLPAEPGRLIIKPKKLGHRLAALVGLGGLEHGLPEFRSAYQVVTNNEPFARAFLNERVQARLLEGQRRPIEVQGGWIGTSRDVSLTAAEVDAALDLLNEVIDHAPRHEDWPAPFPQAMAEPNAPAPAPEAREP